MLLQHVRHGCWCVHQRGVDPVHGDGVRWGGAQGIAANGGVKPYLYSPNPYEEGSSIYHLDEQKYGTGSPNALMTPYLDDGEALLRPGSVVVQRGTNHAWANRSGKMCRMLFVLIDGIYEPEIARSLSGH